MDPVACADRFINAAMDGDMEEAQWAVADLTQWFYQGAANFDYHLAKKMAGDLLIERSKVIVGK